MFHPPEFERAADDSGTASNRPGVSGDLIDRAVNEATSDEERSGWRKHRNRSSMKSSYWAVRLGTSLPWRPSSLAGSDASGATPITLQGMPRRPGDPGCFASWALRIVTNKAHDWIQRRQKGKTGGVVDIEQLPAADDESRRDTGLDLSTLLLRLKADQRAILSLNYLEGLSIAEVSEVLGIRECTVKSRLHAARSAFKALWESRTDE
jgi:hypothetical protein